MTPERRREIARKGGASVPPEKRSFGQGAVLAAEGRAQGRRRRLQGWWAHLG